MFEQEYRPQEQISREAAERFAIMVAITRARPRPSAYASKSAAAQCGLSLSKPSKPAEGCQSAVLPGEPVEARGIRPFDRLKAHAGAPLFASAEFQRRRRAVPKMLRTISVPAVRANCLNALELVICSTIDFS